MNELVCGCSTSSGACDVHGNNLTKEDGAGMDELLYEAGDRVADVALILKRHGWDCAVDARDIEKRIDVFRGELFEAFEKV